MFINHQVCTVYWRRKISDSVIPGARGSQRNVVCLGWPIAPSYMSPNAGRGVAGVAAKVQLCKWSLTKLWRFNSILNLWVVQNSPLMSPGSAENLLIYLQKFIPKIYHQIITTLREKSSNFVIRVICDLGEIGVEARWHEPGEIRRVKINLPLKYSWGNAGPSGSTDQESDAGLTYLLTSKYRCRTDLLAYLKNADASTNFFSGTPAFCHLWIC